MHESLHPLPLPILTGILPRNHSFCVWEWLAPHQTPVIGAWTSPLAPVSQGPVNHSPWPPPCSVPLLHHLALPPWVPGGTHVLTKDYQGEGYWPEVCSEFQNPGLLTITENTVSKDGGGAHRATPLAEELLAVDGC